MTEIKQGLRHLLANHFMYDLFQTVVGANRWRRKFLESSLIGKIPEDGIVLDVGCGTCNSLSLLPSTINYIGIDRNESYIKQARFRYKNRRATFLCEDLSANLPEFKEKVDAVLMLGLLHHLNDNECESVFSIASRILKPNGILLTLDPVYTEKQSKLARFVVSRDRGTAIRTEIGYTSLAKKYFLQVDSHIDLRPTFIPYTGITMRCSSMEKKS